MWWPCWILRSVAARKSVVCCSSAACSQSLVPTSVSSGQNCWLTVSKCGQVWRMCSGVCSSGPHPQWAESAGPYLTGEAYLLPCLSEQWTDRELRDPLPTPLLFPLRRPLPSSLPFFRTRNRFWFLVRLLSSLISALPAFCLSAPVFLHRPIHLYVSQKFSSICWDHWIGVQRHWTSRIGWSINKGPDIRWTCSIIYFFFRHSLVQKGNCVFDSHE